MAFVYNFWTVLECCRVNTNELRGKLRVETNSLTRTKQKNYMSENTLRVPKEMRSQMDSSSGDHDCPDKNCIVIHLVVLDVFQSGLKRRTDGLTLPPLEPCN